MLGTTQSCCSVVALTLRRLVKSHRALATAHFTSSTVFISVFVCAWQLYVFGRRGDDERLVEDLGGRNRKRCVLLFPSEDVSTTLHW